MNIEERRVAAEPIKVLEDIPLEEGNPEKLTRIRTSMEEKMKQDLSQFLRKSIDVLAWSHEDMPGFDPSVITHRLNIYPSSKLVRQKKRVFVSHPKPDTRICDHYRHVNIKPKSGINKNQLNFLQKLPFFFSFLFLYFLR